MKHRAIWRVCLLLFLVCLAPLARAAEPAVEAGPKTREHLARYVAKSKELASDYTHLKPWFLSVAIAIVEAKRAGLNTNDGIDRHFVDQATAMKKPIETLETSEFQLELMNSFS